MTYTAACNAQTSAKQLAEPLRCDDSPFGQNIFTPVSLELAQITLEAAADLQGCCFRLPVHSQRNAFYWNLKNCCWWSGISSASFSVKRGCFLLPWWRAAWWGALPSAWTSSSLGSFFGPQLHQDQSATKKGPLKWQWTSIPSLQWFKWSCLINWFDESPLLPLQHKVPLTKWKYFPEKFSSSKGKQMNRHQQW